MESLWRFFMVVLCPAVLCDGLKPHLITILVDDLGWNDVGYHGSDQIKTPNIDALAYSGMILSRHYVLPTCTPSRTALLTGTFPIRSGMQGYPLKGGENRSLPLTFKLKPEWLRELGYRTHLVGKWHLGYETYSHVPNRRGFDSFFGYYNGYIDYYNYSYSQRVGWGEHETEVFYGYDLHLDDHTLRNEKRTYATRELTKRARDVIRNHDASEPLYLYLAQLATHTGNDETLGMQIPEDADVNKTYAHVKDYGRRVLAGCLEELDKSVGVVMEELRQKDMLKNSIIILMSDNGAHTVSVDMAPNWSSNWPLAGTKFTLFEGGIRGAALVWSPLLPKGFVNHGFVHISDWLPTLYSAAGGDVKKLGKIDGVDQWEALKKGTSVKRDHLLVNIDERVGLEGIILDGRYKLIKGGFPNYAHLDLHWGRTENVAPSPKYNVSSVLESPAGRAVQSLPEFNQILLPKRMLEIREKVAVRCEPPDPLIDHQNGFVSPSSDHRCNDFCLFDVIEDPCELHPIEEEEITRWGTKLLNKYKTELTPQKYSIVDLRSNPALWEGAWVPWEFQECAKSVAMEFETTYVNVSLFLAMSWYSIYNARKFRSQL